MSQAKPNRGSGAQQQQLLLFGAQTYRKCVMQLLLGSGQRISSGALHAARAALVLQR
jgi:hypothetical protein